MWGKKDAATLGPMLAAHDKAGGYFPIQRPSLPGLFSLASRLLLAPHRPFCGEACLRKQTQKPGRVPRAPGHLAVFVELLLSMCQAVLGASSISKDPCPPSRETTQ